MSAADSTATVHQLVDAVREQAGAPAGEPYRIPGGSFTPPTPTPKPTWKEH